MSLSMCVCVCVCVTVCVNTVCVSVYVCVRCTEKCEVRHEDIFLHDSILDTLLGEGAGDQKRLKSDCHPQRR